MNYTEVSIAVAVNQILTAPTPVLLPDTCTLLDLIRIPFRVKDARTAVDILNAATYLAGQAQTSPPNLRVVIPPLVPDEWTEHSQHTTDELKDHWSKLDVTIEIAHACARVLDVTLPNAITYSLQSIESKLKDLSNSFFNRAIFLQEDSHCAREAYERAKRGETPADRSGGLKDCVIIEHSIALCSQLRTAGFTEKCVFTTSNTKDFCQSNSTAPKAPLDAQLNGVSLSLTTNWQWTKAELGA